MSNPERYPFRQRERTEPGGYAAPTHDAGASKPAPPPRRRELMALRGGEMPRSRLFNPNAQEQLVDWSASTPALTVAAQPAPRSPRAFRNDTSRGWNRARLLHASRVMAAWAGAVALLVLGLLWSLSEDEIPQTERPRAVAAERRLPPPAVLPATAAPPRPLALPARAPERSVTAAPPPTAVVEKAPEVAKSPSVPEPAGTPPPVPASRVRTASRDDAASPFGKWIVPPRD